MPRVRLLTAALALTLLTAGCAGTDESDDPTLASPQATASPSSSPTPVPCEDVPPTAEPAPDAVTDLAVKPTVDVEDGLPPCDLVITDIVVGTGAEAVEGSAVEVKYVGVLYEGGEEFDASWNRSPDETLPFEVGAPNLIPGFSAGVIGMREGGRRQVVIPSELGYGAQGRPPIPPDAALVFVLDLVEVAGPA